MKRIAILGGSHFIGVHLLGALSDKGHDVTLYNRNITRSPVPYPDGTRLVIGDRNHAEDLERLFCNEFDAVFDLSGYALKQVEPITNEYRDQIGHYIFCSTPLVHREPFPYPLTENDPRVLTQETYGGNKALVEDLLLKHSIENNWPVTIFRPVGVFGAYDAWQIGLVLYRLKNSLPIFIEASSCFRVNPLFIQDLTTAFIAAMNNPTSYGECYGLGGDDSVSPEELIDLCSRLVSCSPIKIFVDNPASYHWMNVGLSLAPKFDILLDGAKVKADLGVEFTKIEDAVFETISWIEKNPSHLIRYSFRGEKYVLNNMSPPLYLKIQWSILDFLVILKSKTKLLMANISWLKALYRSTKGLIASIKLRLHR